jgi:hypothetical protein
MKAAPPPTKAVTSHSTPNVARRAIHYRSQVQFSQTDGGFDSSERVKSGRVKAPFCGALSRSDNRPAVDGGSAMDGLAFVEPR